MDSSCLFRQSIAQGTKVVQLSLCANRRRVSQSLRGQFAFDNLYYRGTENTERSPQETS